MWKSIDNTIDWYNYHKDIGYNGWINLSTTSAATTGNDAAWKAEPTSTVLTHGSGLVNQSTIIMYVWAEIPGYSKFGSYMGNGSSDGQFVHLGFKPALVIYKKSSGSDNWEMHDNKRDTDNPVIRQLYPNSNSGESSSSNVDFLSNGFKHRNTNGNTNESGYNYIYMAWAEEPGVTPFNTLPSAR